MDIRIFKNFENVVQKNLHFIQNKYGERALDLCFSVRDWFETCLQHIKRNNCSENMCPVGLDLFIIVIIADIFQKGIHQLFFNICSAEEYARVSKTDFFRSRKEKTDDRHLEEVRAVFGAHPFDIKSEDKRGCVHWLGDSPTWKREVCAMISRPGEKIEFFPIDISELWRFIEHRYGLLENISRKIEDDRAAFIEEMKAIPIPFKEGMTPIEKLEVLLNEAGRGQRGKIGDAYQYEVQELMDIFACPISAPDNLSMVEAYRNALLPAIGRQRDALQNMTFAEYWKDEPLLDAFALGLSDQYHREVQDLTVSVCSFPLGEEVLRDVFYEKFSLDYGTRQEFLLLIRAYLFTHPNFKEEE